MWETFFGAGVIKVQEKEKESCFLVFQSSTKREIRHLQQEGILYAHVSIWSVEVPQRHFL